MGGGLGRRAARLVIAACLMVGLAAVGSLYAQDEPQGTIHVVQRGENLFRIAQRYGLTTEELAKANSIENPSNIIVGQRLLVPVLVRQADIAGVYIVQYTDTLAKIAQAFETDVATLIALNNLDDPNTIYVGQALTVRGAAPPINDAAPSAPVEPAVTTVTHRVQGGETLFRIALRYGVDMADIQAANDIEDPSRIFAGQDLLVPGAHIEPVVSELPVAIATLDLTPQVLVEGTTSRIRVTTSTPSSVSITFLDRSVPVITQTDAVSHVAFAPVPLGTTSGIHPMTITVTESSGAVTPLTFNVQVNGGFYGTQTVSLPVDKTPLLSGGVEDNEIGILQNLTSRFTAERYFDGPMGLPAAAPMFSAYGAIRSYNDGSLLSRHYGADFAGTPGTPVLAAAAGRVVLADTLSIRGVAVVIDHGWGVYTLYAHMNDRYASLGDFVQSGQAIGTIGSTGRATGAHLHWEVWVSGTPVDPMQWAYEAFP